MENYAAGLSGLSFIAGQWQSEQQQVFHAFCPAHNEDMGWVVVPIPPPCSVDGGSRYGLSFQGVGWPFPFFPHVV